MAEHLNKDEEDLLQSALSDAFSPADVARVSAQQEKSDEPPAAPPPEPAAEGTVNVTAAAEDAWKAEYDEHLAEWRARSAEQREKAEAERAKWEAIRAQEEKEGKTRAQQLSESTASVSGWESVKAGTETGSSPSPADARDLVAGEKQGHHHAGPSSSSPPGQGQEHSGANSEPESSKHEKWEDIPSEMTSSFPSIEFPSDLHSPVSTHRHQHHEHGHAHHAHHGHDHAHHARHVPAHERGTATSAIFDSRLSTKTRVLAVVSSLAINMLLPFINGVMLGFGEIFAKEVVIGWLGWKTPGSTAANVGLRSRGPATADGRRKLS